MKRLLGVGSLALVGYNVHCLSSPSSTPKNQQKSANRSLLPIPTLFKTRKQHLQQITKTPEYDIVIVGGGASGAGVLLDAASRGYKCLLLEADDFSSGASSKSTKLLHGGVRYLQQVFMSRDSLSARIEKYKLVKEALDERSCLIQNAPHMNGKMQFVIPCAGFFQKIYYYAGSVAYHLIYLMNRQKGDVEFNFPYFLNRDDLRRYYPYISDIYGSGIVYEDGQFNDSRLNLTLLLTATVPNVHGYRLQPANILNQAKLTGLQKQNGKISGVTFQDKITKKEHRVRAKYVVNCTGAFADYVRKMDDPNIPKRIVCVAGSHMTFQGNLIGKPTAITLPSSDGRVLLIVPWLNKVIVGTTEHTLEEPTNHPTITMEEKQFIITEMSRLFEKIDVHRLLEMHTSTWTGVRPLVLAHGAKDTKSIARNHVIQRSESGLYSLMGGKWTVYRKMGEQLVDCIEKEQVEKTQGRKFRKSQTRSLKLLGADFRKDLQMELMEEFGAPVGKHLFRNYGSISEEIVRNITDGRLQQVDPETGISRQEIEYVVRNEMPNTIEDVLLRRTRVAFLNNKKVQVLAKLVADVMAKEWDWSESQKERALKQFFEVYEKQQF